MVVNDLQTIRTESLVVEAMQYLSYICLVWEGLSIRTLGSNQASSPIPIPNAIVATTTPSSEAMNESWTEAYI